MNRYQELMDCFRKPYISGEPRCYIVDSNTIWEGERYTEWHNSGDSLVMSGMSIPLSVEFLLCSEHEPK